MNVQMTIEQRAWIPIDFDAGQHDPLRFRVDDDLGNPQRSGRGAFDAIQLDQRQVTLDL